MNKLKTTEHVAIAMYRSKDIYTNDSYESWNLRKTPLFVSYYYWKKKMCVETLYDWIIYDWNLNNLTVLNT